MADVKITELPLATTADPNDLLVIVSDPSGTPVTKKITVENVAVAGDNGPQGPRGFGVVTVTVGRSNADYICTGTALSPTDHSTIQLAIDSLPAAGGIVYIAEGTYYLDDTITIAQANVQITGAGRATELLAVSDYGDVFLCALTSTPTEWPGLSGLQFSNLRFETSVARTSGAAIRANYTHSAIFRDLYICDTTYGISYGLTTGNQPFYNGIYLDAQDQCEITKITAQCSNYSVYLSGSGYANADFSYDGLVRECDFYGVPGETLVGTGVYVDANCGGVVLDKISTNQLEYGVYADTTGTTQGGGILTIRGGYSENNSGTGYYINGYQKVVLNDVWADVVLTGGAITINGCPNANFTINNAAALIYGTPISITGTGTWKIVDNNTVVFSENVNDLFSFTRVANIQALSQADYDSIVTKDPNTLYLITG